MSEERCIVCHVPRRSFKDHFLAFYEETYIQYMTVALGFYGLANLYNLLGFPFLRPVAFAFAALMMVFFGGRMLLFPRTVWKEVNTPTGVIAYQSGVMVIYFFSTMLHPYFPQVAFYLWSASLFFNGVFLWRFVSMTRANFLYSQITPAWYLIFVGAAAGGMTGITFGLTTVPYLILAYGLGAYTLLTPIMMYRLLKMSSLKRKMQPVKAVMCASPALCMVALLTIIPVARFSTTVGLLILSQFFLFWLYSHFNVFRLMPFCVTFSSFTFPLAISTTALFTFRNTYFEKATAAYQALSWLGYLELVIATTIILYVIGLFLYDSYWMWYRTRLDLS